MTQLPPQAYETTREKPKRSWVSFGFLLSVLSSIGSLWILVLMIVINVDVIGRTAFTSPLPGVPELVSLSIVAIIFIQLAHTLRVGRITRAEGLLRFLRRKRPNIEGVLEMIFSLAGAILFAVLFYATYPMFMLAWRTGEFVGVEGYITYPIWPVRLIILIGSACCCVQFLLSAWHNLWVAVGFRTPLEPPPESSAVI